MADPDRGRTEFEDRLRAAEAGAGIERPGAPAKATNAGAGTASGLRVITELLGGLAGGGVIGWFLDRQLGTAPWLLLVLLLLGGAAGFRNVWKMASRPADKS